MVRLKRWSSWHTAVLSITLMVMLTAWGEHFEIERQSEVLAVLFGVVAASTQALRLIPDPESARSDLMAKGRQTARVLSASSALLSGWHMFRATTENLLLGILVAVLITGSTVALLVSLRNDDRPCDPHCDFSGKEER